VILINENTSNTVILTLSEKTTLLNANYLFEVYNDMTNIYKYFIAQDVSGNKGRFNEFNIIESTMENLLGGRINLITEGFYKYNVYEQASSTNLNPLLALNLIDKGKLKFVKASTTNVVYTGNQINYVEYGG